MSPRSYTHKKLRAMLFQRDGWQAADGQWQARCAFGCGAIISGRAATIDRYPVPGRFGGTYVLTNTRLACGPCNWRDGGKYVQPPHERPKSIEKLSKRESRLIEGLKARKRKLDVEGRYNGHGIRMDLL